MTLPWRTGKTLSESEYAALRRCAVFEFCKWDPQVGDNHSLCNFPLIIARPVWAKLARLAEQLAEETLAAEAELAQCPALQGELGLPRSLRSALKSRSPSQSPASEPRVMRFDFHYTSDGWLISEVNSDVPGGFIEASPFTQWFAAHYSGTQATGDPAEAYVAAVHKVSNGCHSIALIHATSYVDDRQVMIYLGQLFNQRGVSTHLASPADLQWSDGQAKLVGHDRPVGALVRFFPAEWLPNLDRATGWKHFFCGSRTPLSNPGIAILTQSKRFPLVWNRLRTSLPTWRATLPETVDPRKVPWQRDERWLLKPALGRVGDSIGYRGVTTAKDWRAISRSARWWPSHWVAQRRFEAIPLMHEQQPYFPVLGIYVIDGHACGIYGRLARRPLIDFQAQDIAVLIDIEQKVRSDE